MSTEGRKTNEVLRKNKVKILIFVIFLLLIILIYKLVETYALFYSELNGTVEIENGVWRINVNNTEVTTGTSVTFNINNITTSSNAHIMAGKLAPGSSGSFIIEINATNTDVSVKYDIMLDEDLLTNSNFVITNIEEINNTGDLVRTDENTYTGVLSLGDIQGNHRARINVEFEWTDIDGTDENIADLAVGTVYNGQFQIPITVHLIQYLGEEIEEYVEGETAEENNG